MLGGNSPDDGNMLKFFYPSTCVSACYSTALRFRMVFFSAIVCIGHLKKGEVVVSYADFISKTLIVFRISQLLTYY